MDPLLAWVIRGGLALLFGTAALHKLTHRRDFYAAVLAYRLLPPRRALAMARGLPVFEALLAGALLAGLAPALPVAAALLAGYAAAIAINLRRGRREIDCGCGGAPQPLSGWLVLRNLALAGSATAAWLLPATGRLPGAGDFLATLAALAALAALYLAIDQLLANAPRHRALQEHG